MSSDWKGRACLVTGGAGFGGSHLCARLLDLGAKVTVVDRVFPRSSFLVLSGIVDRLDLVTGDIRDLDLMRLILERSEIDTIFHLAAQPIAPMSNVIPMETLSINALGTYSVLEAVRSSGCAKRLVFASSGAYYGGTTTDRPINEDDPPGPATNLYGPSKVAGDVAVRAYAQVYGMKAAACRFMNTFGPGDTNFSRIVPRAVRNLIRGEAYDFGDRDDGNTRLDFLYIGDMANAYIKLAEHLDDVSGEAFNFGRGHPTSTGELTRLASRVFDGRDRPPIFTGTPRAKPIVKYLDIAKAKRLLDWEPTISLEDGLGLTIEWYRRFLTKL
jgi:nucleoside-diphosphate-sugar epimerase